MLRSLGLVVIAPFLLLPPLYPAGLQKMIEQDIWVWRVTRLRMALRPEPA